MTLNNVQLAVNAASVAAINFAGGGGGDHATLSGLDNDTAVLTPTDARLTGSGYTVDAPNCTVVSAFSSGAGSNVTFTLEGGDTYVGRYDYSEAASSLNKFYNFAIGFHTAVGNAVAGSGSKAFMAVNPNNADTLNATPTSATIAGSTYSSRANNFSLVAAYAKNNATAANLAQATMSTSSNAGDIIGGVQGFTFTQGTVAGNAYKVYAVYFSKVTVSASANTTAFIATSNHSSDTYTGTPTSSEVKGSNFDVTVQNCGKVQAYAGGTGQTATLKRSATDGVKVWSPTVTENKGTGYDNFAIGYGTINTVII